MKPIVQTPLFIIRQQEEEIALKNMQLQAIGMALAEEKVKNAEKDALLQMFGEELVSLKIEVMQLKGGESL